MLCQWRKPHKIRCVVNVGVDCSVSFCIIPKVFGTISLLKITKSICYTAVLRTAIYYTMLSLYSCFSLDNLLVNLLILVYNSVLYVHN